MLNSSSLIKGLQYNTLADFTRPPAHCQVLFEAFPKLQFWESNLEIRSFARLKA
jgi:hypothetical protein